MKVSYCTTCHKRLWQLKQTLEHNLSFTKVGESELCVLAYNDDTVEPYLNETFAEHIGDGRLKVKTHTDRAAHILNISHMKNLSHAMAIGDVVFNLDADNFIDGVHETLLNLTDKEICITQQNALNMMDGRIGRIGLTQKSFKSLGGYKEDIGSHHDGDIITRALLSGCKIIQTNCMITPIPNQEVL